MANIIEDRNIVSRGRISRFHISDEDGQVLTQKVKAVLLQSVKGRSTVKSLIKRVCQIEAGRVLVC